MDFFPQFGVLRGLRGDDPTRIPPSPLLPMGLRLPQLEPATVTTNAPDPNAAPSVAQTRPNLLARIFGGSGANGDPRAANEAGWTGLRDMGLAMMMASGPAPVKASLGQVLAQGVMGGQQGYERAFGQLQARAAAAQRANIMRKYEGKSDVESLQNMMQDFLAMGDLESAKPIAEYLKSAVNANGNAPKLSFHTIDTKDGQLLIGSDPTTGAEVSRQLFPGAGKDNAISEYQRQMLANARSSAEDRMADDYRSATRNVQQSAENWAVIRSSGQAALEGDAAAQMALIFSYMKMLDPGSTVREGEYATAENARGVSEQVRNAWNKVLDGQFLTPDQVKRFLGQAERSAKSWRQRQGVYANQYRSRAKKRGYDPESVVFDWFADLPMTMQGNAQNVRDLVGDP